MRLAHPLPSFVWAVCAATLAGWAQAQSLPPSAADPDSAAVAVLHTPLPASGTLAPAETDWRSANAAVAAFPRGHADILAWEAAQARAAAAPAPAPAPAAALPAPQGTHSHPPSLPAGGRP